MYCFISIEVFKLRFLFAKYIHTSLLLFPRNIFLFLNMRYVHHFFYYYLSHIFHLSWLQSFKCTNIKLNRQNALFDPKSLQTKFALILKLHSSLPKKPLLPRRTTFSQCNIWLLGILNWSTTTLQTLLANCDKKKHFCELAANFFHNISRFHQINAKPSNDIKKKIQLIREKHRKKDLVVSFQLITILCTEI